MKNLSIYRASAGSGKTFQLASEYVALMLEGVKNGVSFNHKHVLAVTFTNKATAEMKERILQVLWMFKERQNTAECNDYFDAVRKITGLQNEEISSRAKVVLSALLYDYTHFAVSTIDKFFQQVIRSFAREIGVHGGYQVEVDDQEVREMAIAEMIAHVHENKAVFDWLLSFAYEKQQENKSWDFRKDIGDFAKSSLTDEFKMSTSTETKKNMFSLENLQKFQQELKSVQNGFLKKLDEKLSVLESALPSNLGWTDFKGGQRSVFLKIKKFKAHSFEENDVNRFCELDNGNEWFSKTSNKKSEIERLQQGGEFLDALRDVITLFQKDFVHYNTVNFILKHIREMGILSEINDLMQKISRERKSLLINNSNVLLHNIIDGSETPFVYEKVGTRINHFMIDEFQDTSTLQWENFRPLIENTDSDKRSLVVGDAKQSIYRWRSADSSLIGKLQGKAKTLDRNFRSLKNIVDFNNAFFSCAPHQMVEYLENKFTVSKGTPALTQYIKQTYQDVCQKDSGKGGGHVKIQFLQGKSAEELLDNEGRPKELEMLRQEIADLQDRGFLPKDITILIRNGKKEAPMIVDYLLDYKNKNPEDHHCYDVISDEALEVSSSMSVKFIICVLRYLRKTEDAMSLYMFKTALEELDKCDDDKLQELKHLRTLPLFEMTEGIIALFELGKKQPGESIYLQSFQDLVFEYCRYNSSDLTEFLSWWDVYGMTKNISSPKEQDAINLITIHKSKGLAAEVILIPFFSWDVVNFKKSNVIWMDAKRDMLSAPFDTLEHYPVMFSRDMENTNFSDRYQEEVVNKYSDDLNLAYVAFTRAKKELVVFAQPNNAQTKTEGFLNVGDMLMRGISLWNDCREEKNKTCTLVNLRGFWHEDTGCFELGNPVTKKSAKEATSEKNDFCFEVLQDYVPTQGKECLKMKLSQEDVASQEKSMREYGIMMHDVLQQITRIDDAQDVIDAYAKQKNLSDNEVNDLRNRVDAVLANDKVKEWFSEDFEVKTEQTILMGEKMYRPDRLLFKNNEVIVIDYKFGDKPYKSHKEQVCNYMDLLSKMGYTTKGYLYYEKLGRVEEC